MYTSDIERVRRVRRLSSKTAMAYFEVSVLCAVIANIYALFGHGVRSDSMDFMFLYPLLGGSLVFLLNAVLTPLLPERMQEPSRIGYNLYNSGIASLTSAAMLTGIMEIAGTGSSWIGYLRVLGMALLAVAAACKASVFLKRNN